MKTTKDLPDERPKQARSVSRREGATTHKLVEEGQQRSLVAGGLQCSLETRGSKAPRRLDFPTYGGSGLTSAFQGAPWSRIRDEIYREHGAGRS